MINENSNNVNKNDEWLVNNSIILKINNNNNEILLLLMILILKWNEMWKKY